MLAAALSTSRDANLRAAGLDVLERAQRRAGGAELGVDDALAADEVELDVVAALHAVQLRLHVHRRVLVRPAVRTAVDGVSRVLGAAGVGLGWAHLEAGGVGIAGDGEEQAGTGRVVLRVRAQRRRAALAPAQRR